MKRRDHPISFRGMTQSWDRRSAPWCTKYQIPAFSSSSSINIHTHLFPPPITTPTNTHCYIGAQIWLVYYFVNSVVPSIYSNVLWVELYLHTNRHYVRRSCKPDFLSMMQKRHITPLLHWLGIGLHKKVDTVKADTNSCSYYKSMWLLGNCRINLYWLFMVSSFFPMCPNYLSCILYL